MGAGGAIGLELPALRRRILGAVAPGMRAVRRGHHTVHRNAHLQDQLSHALLLVFSTTPLLASLHQTRDRATTNLSSLQGGLDVRWRAWGNPQPTFRETAMSRPDWAAR